MIEFQINFDGFDVLIDGDKCGEISQVQTGYYLTQFNFSEFCLDADELRAIADKLDSLNQKHIEGVESDLSE